MIIKIKDYREKLRNWMLHSETLFSQPMIVEGQEGIATPVDQPKEELVSSQLPIQVK